MNGKLPVSVVMIFLNAAKFIEEAIESVFAQTYSSWELLLVDDGSTDASTEIARNYANQYVDQVRYLEHAGHKNRGMSASRNLGTRNCKGKCVAFLDADDLWLSHKLERQTAILESKPKVAMVYGATQYWYSWIGILKISNAITSVISGCSLTLSSSHRCYSISFWDKLVLCVLRIF
jgi:glycosyltransferase involved in cell wall biosynthesis